VPVHAARDGVVADVEGLSETGVPDERVEIVEQLDIRAERRRFLDERAVPLRAGVGGVAVGGDHRVLAVAAGRAHKGVLVAGDIERGGWFVHTIHRGWRHNTVPLICTAYTQRV
jgi:hypothetical protein